jgi:hypothetical protein
VSVQAKSTADFHLPEPWSGNLEQAPVLFLGSNPSLAEAEEYPLQSWPDEFIEDFFTHRFGGGSREWVRNGKYTLLRNGSHAGGWVRYWASTRKRAAELLGKSDAQPGADYVMSEVVHCKSRHEQGVAEEAAECTYLYLRRLVAESGASAVASLGRFAERAVRREFNAPDCVNLWGPVEVGGRPRYLVFVPHPNAFAPKTIANCLSVDEIRRLRCFLGR